MPLRPGNQCRPLDHSGRNRLWSWHCRPLIHQPLPGSTPSAPKVRLFCLSNGPTSGHYPPHAASGEGRHMLPGGLEPPSSSLSCRPERTTGERDAVVVTWCCKLPHWPDVRYEPREHRGAQPRPLILPCLRISSTAAGLAGSAAGRATSPRARRRRRRKGLAPGPSRPAD